MKNSLFKEVCSKKFTVQSVQKEISDNRRKFISKLEDRIVPSKE